jgi:uncharacterized protein YuzB (UPF0349 family)
MTIAVDFCQVNFALGTDKIRDALLEDSELDIEVTDYGCLGNCGQCFQMPFALVEGDIVAADTPDELLTKIKDKIKQKEQEAEEWGKLGF